MPQSHFSPPQPPTAPRAGVYGVVGFAAAAIHGGVGGLFLLAGLAVAYANAAGFLAGACWFFWKDLRRTKAARALGRTPVMKFTLSSLAIYGATALSIVWTSAAAWPEAASLGLAVALGALASVLIAQIIVLAPSDSPPRMR